MLHPDSFIVVLVYAFRYLFTGGWRANGWLDAYTKKYREQANEASHDAD